MSSLSIGGDRTPTPPPTVELTQTQTQQKKYWHYVQPEGMTQYDLKELESKPTLYEKKLSGLALLKIIKDHLKNDDRGPPKEIIKMAVVDIRDGYRTHYCPTKKFLADYFGWTISLFYETDLMKVNRLAAAILAQVDPQPSTCQKITALFQRICPCLRRDPPLSNIPAQGNEEERVAFETSFVTISLDDKKSTRYCQCFWNAIERIKTAFKPRESSSLE